MIRLVIVLFLVTFFTIPSWGQHYVPTNIADFTITDNGGNSCEYMFMTSYPFYLPSSRKAACMLLNSKGEIQWYNTRFPYTYNFQLHPNGQMSYFFGGYYYLLDTNFTLIDSLRPLGYTIDLHEMKFDSVGHRWHLGLIFEDSVDLSSINTINNVQGSLYGTLETNVIQELDAMGNVVKEWKGADHYEVDDADINNFTNPSYLPLMHTNSIDFDGKGNVMISNRQMSEVTLINWATGDIIWRLGGAENQFTFVNDTLGISAQHDARFLPGNRISIFDNGTYRPPYQARALIYHIDTATMTATLEWESRLSEQSIGLGSFQFAPDSSRLINWGNFSNRKGLVTIVDTAGNQTWEMEFQNGYFTYRAYCTDLPFQLPYPAINCHDSLGYTVLSISGSHDKFEWNTGERSASIAVNDTGRYFAYVSHGHGMIRSQVFHLTDATMPCNQVGIAPAVWVQPERTGLYDLMGRKVSHPVPGQVYIEVFSDGTRKKRVILH